MSLIVTLLLLLLAGPVWAERLLPGDANEPGIPCGKPLTDGCLELTHDGRRFFYEAATASFHDCEWRMVQAMRAMEPHTVAGSTFRWVYDGSKDLLQIDQLTNQRKSLMDAATLWDATKHDCWRQP